MNVLKLWASFVNSQECSLSFEKMSEICNKFIDEFLFAKIVLRKSPISISKKNEIENSVKKSENESIADRESNNYNIDNNNKISESLIKLGTVKIGGLNTDILTRIIVDGMIYSTWNIFIC